MSRIDTTQYIRKPLYVAAVRVTGVNFDDVSVWCQGDIQEDEVPNQGIKKYIRVRVHNPKNPRQTKAFVGDWLLYTERGYKVYTNKAFHASFDEVTSNGNGNGTVEDAEEMNPLQEILPGLTLQDAVTRLRNGSLQLDPTPKQGVEAEESEQAA